MERIVKTFEIETSIDVMRRIERFFALLHHNSNYGHSSTFAMPLDGDGADKVKVTPTPGFAQEVDAIGGVGGSVEIAYSDSFTCKDLHDLSSHWNTRMVAGLFKNGKLMKTIPRD